MQDVLTRRRRHAYVIYPPPYSRFPGTVRRQRLEAVTVTPVFCGSSCT